MSSSFAARGWSGLVGRLAGISEDEALVARRGFTVDRPEIGLRLEEIGRTFVRAYNCAARASDLHALVGVLDEVPAANSGFAYEGAAMGLAVADWMTPGRQMFSAYVAGPAHPHEYMAWVGMGWAFARLPLSPVRALARHTSVNRWLALDGYGFHEGYFNWRKSIAAQRKTHRLEGDMARVFDQGLGRSMWFVYGARPRAVASAIGYMAQERHADLWAGVGLAATYAGGVDEAELRELAGLAAAHGSALRQGAVFAAEALFRAGNAIPHTHLACQALLGMSHGKAAAIATSTIPSGDSSVQAYQAWRMAIQERCRPLQFNQEKG